MFCDGGGDGGSGDGGDGGDGGCGGDSGGGSAVLQLCVGARWTMLLVDYLCRSRLITVADKFAEPLAANLI